VNADSVGTAGGFAARGGAIGDVYVGESVMNHDRRIQIPVLTRPPGTYGCDFGHAVIKHAADQAAVHIALHDQTCMGYAQGFDKYGIGAYDGLPVPHLIKALGLKVHFCWLHSAAAIA